MIRSLNLHKDLTFFNHYKHLNTYKDTPKTLPSNHTVSQKIKNCFIFIIILKTYFLMYSVSFATHSLEFQCLITPATITELVTNTLTNMIVLIVAIQLSYLSVLLSENDPKLYFHTRRISFIYYSDTPGILLPVTALSNTVLRLDNLFKTSISLLTLIPGYFNPLGTTNCSFNCL